jgi:two-component system chemotaxis response regulator CheY
MHVLVCDDDASTRFAARRLLEEHFGCVVHEAPDGAEALTMLAQQRYTFMLLDVDMPGLSGLDTLEEVRASDVTRALPVVVLSNERREHAIIKLMQLGVSDYILKPLRPATFTSKVEAVVQALPKSLVDVVDTANVLVKQDSPALIADGNLDFRFFFANQVSRYGPVVQAESGAAALAAFKRSPSGVVFIGNDLGVVSPERLATKIREAKPAGVRLVRIAELPQDVTLPSEHWDGVVKRTFLPDTFRDWIRPYVFIPGPLYAVTQMVPNLTDVIDGVTANVFGTMFNAEVTKSKAETPVSVAYTALLDVSLVDKYAVRVGIHLPKVAAQGTAGQMLGMPGEDLGDEDLVSVTGELANLLSGRLHARFREKGLSSTVGLPSVTPGSSFAKPKEGEGVMLRYGLPSSGDFLLSITAVERVAAAPAAAETSMDSAAATGATAEPAA